MSIRVRNVVTSVSILSIGLAVPALVGVPAQASGRAAPAPGFVRVTREQAPMEYVGIDDKQAAAAGNKVVISHGTKRLVDGRTGREILRVAAPGSSSRPGGTVSPQSTARGSCGTSFIEIYWRGGSNIRVDTGFDLNKTAVAWSWAFQVHASDRRGAFNWEWDDYDAMLGKQLRISKSDTTDMRGAYHTAGVTKGSAVTATGGICKSGLPTDAIYVPN